MLFSIHLLGCNPIPLLLWCVNAGASQLNAYASLQDVYAQAFAQAWQASYPEKHELSSKSFLEFIQALEATPADFHALHAVMVSKLVETGDLAADSST